MSNYSKLALAVAATLAATSAFAAIDQNTAFDVKLNVAGSSAFRDAFKTEMGNVLCSDAPVVFQTGTAIDLKAYGCTLKTSMTLADGSTVYTFPANKTVLVYYRSEGGSVYGVGPIAKPTIQQTRLKVDSTCTGTATPFTCAVSALNLTTDVATGTGAEKGFVQLGVSDLEPTQFKGSENWPGGGFLGNAPTNTELGNITSVSSSIGQVFGVYVNLSNPGVSGGSINLTRQALTSIFSGAYTNWNQVPKADGSGKITGSSLPIKICLRDIGSGTQAGASIFFNGQNCSSAAYGFAKTGNLARNASTGSEVTCISSATNGAGTIGFAAVQTTVPAGTALVNLGGVTPSPITSANGTYDYWYEATFNSGAKLDIDEGPLANQNASLNNSNAAAVAAIMIDRLINAATTPVVGTGAGQTQSVFSLPNAQNSVVLPVDASHPVATGTRGGNSCFLQQGG
jgi:PBP superfamily domain